MPESSISQPPAVPATELVNTSVRLWRLPLAASAILLVLKFFLIARINVNWDEFLFLSHIHALLRGDLGSAFQTAYTHLFTWLPAIGDEMAEIIVARWLMTALFAVTVVLIVKLASRWASASASWVAALCYITMSPVLVHGGSFRADSLLAPLTMAVLVLLAHPESSRRAAVFAGICFGAALAISVKAVFLLPIMVAFELVRPSGAAPRWRIACTRLLLLGGVAGLVAAAAFGAHWLSVPPAADVDAQGFASRAFNKTLRDVPFFPRWEYLQRSLANDKASWILIAFGALWAARQRRWAALACALSLAPLVIYRNAFPYYYVVMLAPACILAALAVDGLQSLVRGPSSFARAPAWLWAALCVLLIVQGVPRVILAFPEFQQQQRDTIAAVHEIFPAPVPYIDHSGMIASFPKVNFFMSSWGVERYRAAGVSFMHAALKRRPPLLLANRGEIDPDAPAFGILLPEDQQLIRQYYVQYWGPIWVAGTRVDVPPSGSVEARLPFPGRYRLESRVPLVVDGISRSAGDVLTLQANSCVLSAIGAGPGAESLSVRLVWADAAAPPSTPPPEAPMYEGL